MSNDRSKGNLSDISFVRGKTGPLKPRHNSAINRQSNSRQGGGDV